MTLATMHPMYGSKISECGRGANYSFIQSPRQPAPYRLALRMNVLGEPIGRQVMAEARLLRLAVHHGSGGGELVAQSQIVDEAGHFAVGAPQRCLAGDHLGQRRRARKIDTSAKRPALVA